MFFFLQFFIFFILISTTSREQLKRSSKDQFPPLRENSLSSTFGSFSFFWVGSVNVFIVLLLCRLFLHMAYAFLLNDILPLTFYFAITFLLPPPYLMYFCITSFHPFFHPPFPTPVCVLNNGYFTCAKIHVLCQISRYKKLSIKTRLVQHLALILAKEIEANKINTTKLINK